METTEEVNVTDAAVAHMMRLKSAETGEPSEYLSSLGMTVQPNRTPVKPAYLEKELTSMAQVLRGTGGTDWAEERRGRGRGPGREGRESGKE